MAILNLKFPVQIRCCKLGLVLIFVLTIFQKSYSQVPSRKETIDYLNRRLGVSNQVEMKGNNIIITFRDEKGNITREDKAPVSDLDLNVSYEKETDLICIPCLKDAEGCVTRTLIVQKIKRPYNRISIIAGGENKFAAVQKAFEHLIRIESVVGYKDEVPFE